MTKIKVIKFMILNLLFFDYFYYYYYLINLAANVLWTKQINSTNVLLVIINTSKLVHVETSCEAFGLWNHQCNGSGI